MFVGVAMGVVYPILSVVEEEREDEEEVSQLLSDDYARAEFIRDRLVPKAVLFFTGEIMEDEDDVRRGPGCGCSVVCCLFLQFDMEEGLEEEDDEEDEAGDDVKDQVCI